MREKYLTNTTELPSSCRTARAEEQGVSVIMPVYNQASFVRCALSTLLSQTYTKWELIIVDDGSLDGLHAMVADFLENDLRIHYCRNTTNKGLGYSLNKGIGKSIYPYIAYLPADDILYENHLETLVTSAMETDSDLVCTGMTYHEGNVGGEGQSRTTLGKNECRWFQLIQILHRKTADVCWMERDELVTDDLGRMFWTAFMAKYPRVAYTEKVTCEWVSHLYQRHVIMNDRAFGGIYMYKTFYKVKSPIRYQSSVGSYIDEIERYKRFRQVVPCKKDGLKILLVGELSYNPERIYSLEKRGHRIYGLWINNPFNFNTVGHLPFGHVEDIPFENWEERVKEIKPDIIYAQLNFKAIDLAYHVFKKNTDIPFVWHFKEGPFYGRSYGGWEKLMELYEKADGAIYINKVARDWYHQFMRHPNEHTLVLDGDLPPAEWFEGERSPLLSDMDGEMHTLVAGRLLGISSLDIEQMAENHIHIHIYGDIYQNQARMMIDEAMALAPDYVHLHHSCDAANWVQEFSQYDAGWLHCYHSSNHGNLARANWIDFNSPARLSTYAMAGVPMIMTDNTGHIVHHQKYLEDLGMALPISSISDLKRKFQDKPLMHRLRENTWRNREKFCFDHYVEDLECFFHEVIDSKRSPLDDFCGKL